MSRLETIDIEKIRIHHRVRRDLGDLGGLKESMRRHGLFNPLVVTQDYVLVAGRRRLESARELGWRAVQCRIVDQDDRTTLLEIEIEENTARRDFTSDELADALVRLDRLRSPSWWRRAWRSIVRFLRAVIHRLGFGNGHRRDTPQ